MRHFRPSGFLFLAVISVGASGASVEVADSSNKVSVTAAGALQRHQAKEAAAAQVRRSEQKQSPDDSPFEISTPNVQATSANPVDEGLRTQVAGTPFAVDPNFMPFVPDDGKVPAAEMQATEGSVVNDSPFLLDSETSTPEPEGPRGRHGEKLPLVNTERHQESTFVIESEEDDEEDKQQQKRTGDAKKTDEGIDSGTLTIVRSGKSEPGQRADTTTFVMNMQEASESTSPQPTTSTEFKFELGDSLLELSSGQKFVHIPDTPFEVEWDVAMSIANRRKRRIELVRPEPSPAVLAQSEVKMVPATPHSHTQRMMRNEELQDPISSSPADTSLEASLIMNQDSAPDVTAKPADKSKEKQLDAQDKPDSASAGVASPPIHSQTAVDAPGTRPSVQLPPSDSTGNSTMSADGSVSNITAPEILPNGSANASAVHAPRAVSTRGAIASITLGLIITIFCLSILVTILNAGRKEDEQGANKEPPLRATTPYRQVLIAQQQPEATTPVA
jgi:hypothetical protein